MGVHGTLSAPAATERCQRTYLSNTGVGRQEFASEFRVKNELNPIGGTGRGPIGAGGPACIRRAGGITQSPRPDVEVGLIEKKVKRHRNQGLVRCELGLGYVGSQQMHVS